MPPIHILIKPASGSCNMRCTYCFYADVTGKRETPCFGMMSVETLETVVRKALAYASDECSFTFQGGEPTLAGLDFYNSYVELLREHGAGGLRVHSALQTNGYAINDAWAEFFARYHFLIGLSLDGTKDIHDRYRLEADHKGTYNTVLHTAQLFRKHGVEFNILTVVTAQTTRNVGKMYRFFKRSGLYYQQYIPCLDPFGEERGHKAYSLVPAQYGDFLKKLFDLWYQDIIRGDFAYNRYFKNLVGILRGHPPESCGMMGYCSRQLAVEADGGVYPCDFYVMDEYKIGDLARDSFEEIEQNRKAIGFVEASRIPSPACLECPWRNLCRGGCRRDREPMADGKLSLNYFCPAYKAFFEYAIDRLILLAKNAPGN